MFRTRADLPAFKGNNVLINEEGKMLMYKELQDNYPYLKYQYYSRVRTIIDLPPLLQVARIINTNKLIALTQSNQIIMLDETHPTGVDIGFPPARRVYESESKIYILDVSDNLHFFKLDGENVELIHIIDNVRFISRYQNNDKLAVLAHDNHIHVYKDDIAKTRLELIITIQILGEVQTISGPVIFLTSGRVMILLNNEGIITLTDLIELDYPVRDIIYHYQLKVIGEDGTLRSYYNDGQHDTKKFETNLKRFIRFSYYYIIEDENNKLRDINGLIISDLMQHKLINLKELEDENRRLRLTKSAKSREE